MQTAGADAKIIKGLKVMLNFWTTTHKEYRTAWEEWQAYKLEPIVGDALDDAKEMHPKEWWRNNGRAWPTLTRIIMKVPTTYCLLPSAYYLLLPTTYYLLPTTTHHYLLTTTSYYLLPTT